jgi:hypothetical protein
MASEACFRVLEKVISICLELGNDSVSTGLGDGALLSLELCVGHLAVIDDNGVASGTLTSSPADGGAELDIGVVGKDLE